MHKIHFFTMKYIVITLITALFTIPSLCEISLANSNNTHKKIYNFGVITLTHPLVIYRQYLPFVDYMNAHLDWEFKLVLYKEYSHVIQAIKDGELDMALLGGDSFIQTIEHTSLKPIVAVLSRDGSPKTYSIIVAKEDNKAINNLNDLRGKSMAFGPRQSTSSYVVPINFLSKHHIYLKDLKSYQHLSTHDAVLRAVLRGDYDAGAVGEAFGQRFLGQGLKVIANTEKFPSFLIVAGPDVPKQVHDAVTTLLLSINPKSEEFKKASMEWPEILRNGFAPVQASDYEVFQTLIKLPLKKVN